MKIIELKTMRGPNYWSMSFHKLIILKLDLSEFASWSKEEFKSLLNKIEDIFVLYKNDLNPDAKDDYEFELKEVDTSANLVMSIIAKLQSLINSKTEFCKVLPTKRESVYQLIYSYEHEDLGKELAKSAVSILDSIINYIGYNIHEYVERLSYLKRKHQFGPSTQSIVNEAVKRDIPYMRLNQGSLVMLGQGAKQKMIRATMTDNTSSIGVDFAANKEVTKNILSKGFIPVPPGILVYEEAELKEAIDSIGFPLVVKPLDANHGRGISINITSESRLTDAFNLAKTISADVIIEKYIKGHDYRFLLINYKLIAVAKRTPAFIIGDGESSIATLIEITNSDPLRGTGHENILTQIEVDSSTISLLSEKNMNLDTVLASGQICYLKDTANISTGGTARDVTDLVHPSNIFMAERIARLMKLDICGIDIIAENISVPITKKNGAVIEVNACPGFRMHLNPTKGIPRNVAEAVIDGLYPNGETSRIPIVAITGTNGKTTTTRLVAHLASNSGKSVGFTTTDGIYINGQLVYAGDCSGPSSAAVILQDPIVDYAVLECARGGILRAGLGFDKCNISVVTNITEDHLGISDIDTIEELANVKKVVAASTMQNGYAILNADDKLVYNMKSDLKSNVALFSMHPHNVHIKEHCAEGGLASTIENGYFIICKGDWKIRLIKVVDVPLSFKATSNCMMQNILGAILVAYTSNIKIKQIAEGLKSFIPSPELTPGRMNMFEFKNFSLMVDYAHNEGGYKELKKYLKHIKASRKTGIVAATGDRRDEDIRNVGFYAAQMFDKIIIRHDEDGRGRSNQQLSDLIKEGINMVNNKAEIHIISDELEALSYAIEHAEKNSFIVLCSDDIQTTLHYISDLQSKEKEPKNVSVLM